MCRMCRLLHLLLYTNPSFGLGKLTPDCAVLCGHNPLYPTQKGNVFTIPSNMFLDSSPPPDWSDRPVTASSTDSVLAIWTSFTSRSLVFLRHCDYTKHSQEPGVYAEPVRSRLIFSHAFLSGNTSYMVCTLRRVWIRCTHGPSNSSACNMKYCSSGPRKH